MWGPMPSAVQMRAWLTALCATTPTFRSSAGPPSTRCHASDALVSREWEATRVLPQQPPEPFAPFPSMFCSLTGTTAPSRARGLPA